MPEENEADGTKGDWTGDLRAEAEKYGIPENMFTLLTHTKYDWEKGQRLVWDAKADKRDERAEKRAILTVVCMAVSVGISLLAPVVALWAATQR